MRIRNHLMYSLSRYFFIFNVIWCIFKSESFTRHQHLNSISPGGGLKETFLNNSLTPQDIVTKFFKFNLHLCRRFRAIQLQGARPKLLQNFAGPLSNAVTQELRRGSGDWWALAFHVTDSTYCKLKCYMNKQYHVQSGVPLFV